MMLFIFYNDSAMITKAFIEELGSGRMESEMQDVYDELRHRNIPVELFIGKRLVRRKLSLARNTLVVGYVETVLAALQQLGLSAPPTNDYPSALQPYFHRHIWKSTLHWLHNWILEGNNAVLAKPDGRKKRFTGHVFRNVDDLQYIEGASKNTPIWCSDVVKWLSEYRVFVLKGEIIGIQHYFGDPMLSINEQIVSEALLRFEQSGEATAAYALDFGVLADGSTALVEWNDGFSLGSYGLDKKLYTDLLIARWIEWIGIE
jgi:hypothetical protein